MGDRTGEARRGVFEAIWREVAAEKPAFVLQVGDNIQGREDATAEAQWKEWQRIIDPYRRIPLYAAPGNHDVWSEASAELFRRYTGRALHYGFDYGQAHFTVLDNSRSEQFSDEELAFLEKDLAAHERQPLKFVVSHRPSWIMPAALGSTEFPLHRIAKKYGVTRVIAGHVHQLIHTALDGVEYVAMPSSGAHLRSPGEYTQGQFFGHGVVAVSVSDVKFKIREAGPPYGKARVTSLDEWGLAGLRANGE